MQYASIGSNPFAVLTAIVAPAILTNASSILALGTSNRLGRVVDRTRVVAGELDGFEPGSPEYESWAAQLDRLPHLGLRRSRLCQRRQHRTGSAVLLMCREHGLAPNAPQRLHGCATRDQVDAKNLRFLSLWVALRARKRDC